MAQNNQNNSGGNMLYDAASGLMSLTPLIAAGVSLYTASGNWENDEAQREHERDMANRAETNSNISVQTGKVIHEHHHYKKSDDSNDKERMTSEEIRALTGSQN